MPLTNNLNLPPALARALAKDDYSRGQAHISVTGLISPARQVALIEAHREELTEDVADRVYAVMGRMLHKLIEDESDEAADGTVVENRFFMRVPGPLGEWIVSGAMDNIDLVTLPDGSVRIEDWKTAKTDEMIFGVKAEREAQLNIYKILLEANGYKVGALRDYFLLRDHSKTKARRENSRPSLLQNLPDQYPKAPVVVHDVEMWEPQRAYEYIMERVAAHQDAQNAYEIALQATSDPQIALPECTTDEQWARPPKYAAVKVGASRATKLFDTEAEALEFVTAETPPLEYTMAQVGTSYKVFKGDSARASKTFASRAEALEWINSKNAPLMNVVARHGEAIRCLDYCLASQICAQHLTTSEGDAEES